MKTVFLLALLACLVALISGDCVYTDGDGEPHCDANNVNKKYFRNNWDPTSFWVCDKEGQPASVVRCEQSGYLDSMQQCVDWSQWTWIDPCDPPNMVVH